MQRALVGAVAVVAAAAGAAVVDIGRPAAQDRASGQIDLRRDRLVDRSHAFKRRTIYWPTAQRVKLTRSPKARRRAAGSTRPNFAAAEHGGTHLDAPIHLARGGDQADEIPLRKLIGPGVNVDVRAPAQADRDYLISVADITAWEQEHARIPRRAIILLPTGWAGRWPNARRYLGIDTASIDREQSTLFEAHRVLGAAQVPVIENVARLGALPADGFQVIALPMKIAGGSGGPLGVVGSGG